MIAAYCRVSTSKQKLTRQVRNVIPYIERRFDIPVEQDIDELADHVADPETSDAPLELAGGDILLTWDRLTGTNTDRSGYHRVMDEVENGSLDAVVTDTVARMSRSLRDLDRTADHIVEAHRTEYHTIKEGFQLDPENEDPYQRAMFQLLGVFAELEAKMAQMRAREGLQARIETDDEYHHGRAPLGYVKTDDGGIRPGPEYDMIVAALEDVQAGELSKRIAAKRLDTSRRTINRSLDERGELYGL